VVGGLVVGGRIDSYWIKTSRTGRAMCECVFNLLCVHNACVMFQPLEIDDDYCGEHDINHPIRGTDAVSAIAAVTWSDDDVTSVAVATPGNHTVAFVGTSSGQVKKVLAAIFHPLSQSLLIIINSVSHCLHMFFGFTFSCQVHFKCSVMSS